MTSRTTTEDLPLRKTGFTSLAHPTKGISWGSTGGSRAVTTNKTPSKLSDAVALVPETKFHGNDLTLRQVEFHVALRPSMNDCGFADKSSREDVLREKLCSMQMALAVSFQHEDRLRNKMKERKESALKIHEGLVSHLARLRKDIIEVEHRAQKEHQMKNIISRNSTAVLKSLKEGLSDPPEDKDELETECLWEMSIHCSLIDKKQRDLQQQKFVVHTARGIFKQKYGDLITNCQRVSDVVLRTAHCVEGTLVTYMLSSGLRIVNRVIERELEVETLKIKLSQVSKNVKREEAGIASRWKKLNQTHVQAMREGRMTNMIFNTLRGLFRAMENLDVSKNDLLRHVIAAIKDTDKEEKRLKWSLGRTRNKAIDFGHKTAGKCQDYARVRIQPPSDFSHVTIDYGCLNRVRIVRGCLLKTSASSCSLDKHIDSGGEILNKAGN